MKQIIYFILIVLGLSVPLAGKSVTLSWDPVDDADLRTYRIHWGTASQHYEFFADVGTTTTYTLVGLQDDVKYYFVVTAIDFWGNESEFSNEVASSGSQQQPSLPQRFDLGDAYPNPFNPQTSIEFALPVDSRVTISIFNFLGQRIKILEDGMFQAGYHSSVWNATDEIGNPVASGTYFCVLEVDNIRITRSMILLR